MLILARCALVSLGYTQASLISKCTVSFNGALPEFSTIIAYSSEIFSIYFFQRCL